MDSVSPATSNIVSIAKTFSKIIRFRRKTTSNTTADFGPDQDHEIHKLKPSKSINDFPQAIPKFEDEKVKEEENCHNKEAMESLLANIFTSISAIKASYAQLQVAQSPYDPETIQSSDQCVVTELKHLSELKRAYFKNQFGPPPPPPLAAQVQEQRNLIRTYKITSHKLESEIQCKGSEITALQAQLLESDRQNRDLESRLHPGNLLSSLDGLHLSELDPSHFLAMVRHTVRSIRSFVKLMIGEMESAGWDLDSAASSIQSDVCNKPGHRIFAFESFICQQLFSDFHNPNFGLSHLEERATWESRQFFVEFAELKSAKMKHFLRTQKGRSSGFGKFCRTKYLNLVHPKMEASFFGDLDQRGLVSSGRGFPQSDFFAGFVEMARRVWLLHCLFFSFGREMEGSIFQVKRGWRFSEVYMESVMEVDAGDRPPVVGFTVMPGFRVGRTVIQCKVYISGLMENGRS